MVARQKVEKMLLAPDGTQSVAQLGMVDRNGALFYVVDEGTMRLDFHPISYLMADVEGEKRSLEDELALVYAAYDDIERRAENLTDLCAEMLECGKFPKDRKTFFKSKYYRNKYKGEVA